MRRLLLWPALGVWLATAHASAQSYQPRMGEPVRGLTAAEISRFDLGKVEFDHILSEAEGLGPIFNDSSCGQCHSGPAVGGFSTRTVVRFGKAASGVNPFDGLEDLGGTLLQETLILSGDPSCQELVPPEADVVVERMTPHTFGAGLLEAVPAQQIQDNATAQIPHPDANGFVRMVTPVEGGAPRPGRFGWKGGVATVLTFSADASLNEMGLTNQFFPMENEPNGDPAKLALCDMVADPEDAPDAMGFHRIERQTDFQRFLAPPPQTPRTDMSGEAVFDSIGCTVCHVKSYTTGVVAEEALSNREIHPYSDFLLHDMGTLGDGIVDGVATERIMATRALWGMGMRDAFLHDGRATGGTFESNVDLAIMEHDGEAAFSRDAYVMLGQVEKDQLYAFLRSLGRPEFDWEINNTVDEFDWFFLEPFFTGPDPADPITPDDPEAVADCDADGAFDLRDFLALQCAFTGQ